MQTSDRSRRAWFVLFFVWAAALVAPSGAPMVDSVLLSAIRLADHGTWTISDGADPRDTFLFEAHDISVYEGRIYSGVGPGAAVLAVPVYVALRPLLARLGTDVPETSRASHYYGANARAMGRPVPRHVRDAFVLQIVLAWLLVAPLFAWFLARFHALLVERGCAGDAAAATVLAVGLGSMALYYAGSYSRQALAYLCIWHGILTWIRAGRPGARQALGAGALFGAALTIDYPGAILIGLALAWFVPRMSLRAGAAALVFPAVAALLLAAYHQTCFGSVWATPYHHRYWFTPEVLTGQGLDFSAFEGGRFVGMNPPRAQVMLQLLFGPYKGLFVYSPVLLLGLAGHATALRAGRQRGLRLASLAVVAVYLTFNSTMGTHLEKYAHFVWGGLSVLWGPRHLLATLPFLAWGLTGLDWNRAAWRRSVWVVLGLSCAINVVGTMFRATLLSTSALGDGLDFPPGRALSLLVQRGPRVPLLEAYGAGPWLQAAVVAALLLATAAQLPRGGITGRTGRIDGTRSSRIAAR